MSDAIIADLNRQLAEARTEAKKHRLARRKALTELAEARSQAEQLAGERDTLKGKLEAAPDEVRAEVDRLRGEIRTRDHRDAWASVRDQLQDKVTLDKVWQELQYTPGDEIPTPEQIAEHVGQVREIAPYLLKSAETANAAPGGGKEAPAPAALPPGPGARRGEPSKDAGGYTVRRADVQRPEWMAQHQRQLAEAGAAGTIRWVD